MSRTIFVNPVDVEAPTETPKPERDHRLDEQARSEIRELFIQFRAETPGTGRHDRLRARLVELNTPLVHYLVRRFRYTAEPMDDIRQVGMIGLLKAIDRFDPERGLEFSTFAVPTILGEIRRYFRDATWAVHVPRGARELSSTLSSAIPELSQRLGREPSVDELAETLDVRKSDVLQAIDAKAGYASRSLEAMAERLGGEVRETSVGFEDGGLEQVERRADLRPALATLPPRQREVLVLRFVYDKSQTQIAEALGVSQMQVSRLLSRSLTQLRAQLSQSQAYETAA